MVNGKRHREDGTAIEWHGGIKAWYLNGKLHREDGPAIKWPDSSKEWYLNGEKVTEEKVMNKPKVINNDSYYTVAIKCNNCYHKFKVNFAKGTVSFNNVVKCVNCGNWYIV